MQINSMSNNTALSIDFNVWKQFDSPAMHSYGC